PPLVGHLLRSGVGRVGRPAPVSRPSGASLGLDTLAGRATRPAGCPAPPLGGNLLRSAVGRVGRPAPVSRPSAASLGLDTSRGELLDQRGPRAQQPSHIRVLDACRTMIIPIGVLESGREVASKSSRNSISLVPLTTL